MFAQTSSLTPVDSFLVLFMSIVFEALPFIVLGALISGTLEVLLPQQLFAKVLPRRRSVAIAGSAMLGLIFPMCECGIVPVMRRLLGKGLPLGCAVAYMLAAPIINPVVIASTWAAFSGQNRLDQLTSSQMVTLRVGLGFLTAFLVGSWVERLAKQQGMAALTQPLRGIKHRPGEEDVPSPAPDDEEEAPPKPRRMSLFEILASIGEVALHDFIDITCYLVLGALLAAGAQASGLTQMAPHLVENPLLSIFYMMALAILLCLCSEADAFVAANMMSVPLSGKIAFLVLGPMLDLKLLFMYTRVFRRRLIVNIIIPVVIIVALLSLMVHYLNQAGKSF
jgi:hypothetical protein